MHFSIDHARLVGRILRDAARDEILPRFRRLRDTDIREKSSRLDVVTAADEAAEARIAADLARAFAPAVVIGEEAASRDATPLRSLGAAELAFVVDPVDGTKNYAAGLPLFGVMAAVLVRGTAVAGVIYDPIGDDCAYGMRGEGAWLESAEGERTPLHAAPPRAPAQMLGIVSWLFMPEPLRSRVTRNLPRVAGAVDYRTAAHEYRLIAAGHYDFVMFGKLSPWDHLAGCLIHREAGGYSACFDGRPYTFDSRAEGLLCAPDEASWHALRDALLAPD